MSRIHLFTLCACLLLIPRASAEGPVATTATPRVDNIFPSSSGVGTKVTITGSGFGNDSTGNLVTFGGVSATEFNTWTPGAIYVTVPKGTKTGNIEVVVSVLGISSNKQTFKVTSPAAPSKSGTCTGDSVSLGALTGKDADALAQTLSSIFRGQFVATSCADKSDSPGDQSASPSVASGTSSSSSNHTLQVKKSGGAPAPKCSAANTSRCPFEGVEATLDRDNFSGGILNSNYVVYVPGFARALANAFPHPTIDIDLEQASDLSGEMGRSGDYLVLVPSSSVVKQAAALKTLSLDAAGLKRDLDLLYEYAPGGGRPRGCPNAPSGEEAAEVCFAGNSIVLSVLDPRDVAMQVHTLFSSLDPFDADVLPLNHSISFVPTALSGASTTAQARALEQYELYKQNQKQTQLIASLQSASPAATPTPAAPVTTTTTTIKTPAPSSSKGSTAGDGSSTTASSATTSISTSTSTTTTPPAAGASASSTAATPASGSAPSAAPAAASATPPPAQPVSPSWGIDNIVRLYDYRDATGIAAAINGMVSYVPNSRPIVQALSDYGANDMIEILPSAAQQNGYTVGDIERAISLLDLPHPQLSLQVWSYQISAKVKNPVEPARNRKVKCPKKNNSSQLCREYGDEDDARTAFESVNAKVDEANRQMIKALESGMDQIFEEALMKAQPIPACSLGVWPSGKHGHPTLSAPLNQHQSACDPKTRVEDPFFQEDFREYLTMKYHDCLLRDSYCIGYYDALDYPSESSGHVGNASLGRLLLFLAAANNVEARTLKGLIIDRMQSVLGDRPCIQTRPLCDRKPTNLSSGRYFSRLSDQLVRVTEPGNLRILRAAFLDFFFNYKWTINYPNDFVPYDLRRSAHTLDDLLQPIVNAFNQDIDEYVQDQLDDPNLIPKTSKAGLVSQGMVSVAALSGTQAMVSGQVSNYFNITQTPSLSQVAQNLLAPSGSSNTGGTPGLQGLISTNPYVVGGEALASMLAPQKAVAQLARGITLTVTPTSLDTASSAELNVNLLVNEPDGAPQSVNTTSTTQDLLDRVASHVVTDTVRVQSLKLFDLSTLSMEITHPQTPTCVPLADDGGWRVLSYFAAVPFSIPCSVWRSTFGSMPVAGRLFEWPRSPITVDNRSVAIIRAVVVPTAMDLGEAFDFESDRVLDPLTQLTESLSSVSQIGWRARQFHRLMMQCVLNSGTQGCPVRLSEIPEDIRKPTTN